MNLYVDDQKVTGFIEYLAVESYGTEEAAFLAIIRSIPAFKSFVEKTVVCPNCERCVPFVPNAIKHGSNPRVDVARHYRKDDDGRNLKCSGSGVSIPLDRHEALSLQSRQKMNAATIAHLIRFYGAREVADSKGDKS